MNLRSKRSDRRQKAVPCLTMVILIFFSVVFSAFYIASETGHDCTGEDCPICACILQCENILHQTGYGTASRGAVIIPVVFAIASTFLFTYVFFRETLVSKKVRLND